VQFPNVGHTGAKAIFDGKENKMAQLTQSSRFEIEKDLRENRSCKEIARKLNVSHTTVMREITKHITVNDKGAKGRVTNRCVNRSKCDRQYLCEQCSSPFNKRKCSTCSHCNAVCSDFKEIICERLARPPYVCNGCHEAYKCVLRKKFYLAEVAHTEYRKLLTQAREGAVITEEERVEISSTLAGGFKKGQSVHHIVAANPDAFNVCEKTLYTYINTGILITPKRHDLPMAPKMKARRKKGIVHKVDPKCSVGRTFEDYEKFLKEHPDMPLVEMDSVEGVKGGKVLLTINFDTSAMMFAFIRDANTSKSVIDVFNMLEDAFTLPVFKRLFPVILTDNGSEFSNPDALETSHGTGERRTTIFYCKPYASWQKPNVENNHLNLRKIFPKGKSLDKVTQEKVALAMSNLNSMCRASLNDIPSIKLFEEMYGRGILEKLEIRLVPAKDVKLVPELIFPIENDI
jgi:IS30 family transposase